MKFSKGTIQAYGYLPKLVSHLHNDTLTKGPENQLQPNSKVQKYDTILDHLRLVLNEIMFRFCTLPLENQLHYK